MTWAISCLKVAVNVKNDYSTGSIKAYQLLINQRTI